MKSWQWFHSAVAVAVPLAIILIGAGVVPGLMVKTQPGSRVVTWLVILVLFTIWTAVISQGVTGRWLGAIIDDRNKMTLSRLQLVLWTVLILSAWLTAALWNLQIANFNVVPPASPLAISLPPEIWAALGISITSFVGTPLILSTKTNKPANENEAERQLTVLAAQKGQEIAPAAPPPAAPTLGTTTAPQSNAAPAVNVTFVPDPSQPTLAQVTYTPDPLLLRALQALNATLQGQVVGYTSPTQASLGDLFRGDEIGNVAQLDLSKLQMFYFTIILVLSYGVMIASLFAAQVGAVTAFPALDQSMIALLVISHAGYLGYKAVPHSADAATPTA